MSARIVVRVGTEDFDIGREIAAVQADDPAVGADDKMHRYQHGGFIRADLV